MLSKLNYIFKGLILSKEQKNVLIDVLNSQFEFFKIIQTNNSAKFIIDNYELEYYYGADGGNRGPYFYCHGEELYNKITKKLDYLIDNKIPCFIYETINQEDGNEHNTGAVTRICAITRNINKNKKTYEISFNDYDGTIRGNPIQVID